MKIKISLLIIAIASLSVLAATYINHTHKQPSTLSSPTYKENASNNNTTSSIDSKNQDVQKDTNNSDSPMPPELDKSTNIYSVQITPNHSVDENSIIISGIINLPLDSGKCTISISGPNDIRKNIETDILMAPTTSHCKSVSILKKDLGQGSWKFNISYNENNIKGQSNEDYFEI